MRAPIFDYRFRRGALLMLGFLWLAVLGWPLVAGG